MTCMLCTDMKTLFAFQKHLEQTHYNMSIRNRDGCALAHNARGAAATHVLEEWRALLRRAVKDDDVVLCPGDGCVEQTKRLMSNQ